MKNATTCPRGKTQGWRFAIWLILAAFSLQSYVIQTHSHGAAPAQINRGISGSPHGKSPVENNPLECPFCLAVAQAGAFHLPTVPLILRTAVGAILTALVLALGAPYAAGGHNWQSRAPPQH